MTSSKSIITLNCPKRTRKSNKVAYNAKDTRTGVLLSFRLVVSPLRQPEFF